MKYHLSSLLLGLSTMASAAYPVSQHSFSRTDARVTHLDLDIEVNFEKKKISGVAAYQVKLDERAKVLILDTNGLMIRKVTLDDETTPAKFTLGQTVKHLGQPLAIEIKPTTRKVSVEYETGADAVGVQWLEPAQTGGKQQPFLFTQSQAILARTWVPCQDTPSLRMTYDAKVRVPKDLMAVMSAQNPTKKNSTGIYTFKMEQPIPSYLLALAVGDIAFKAIDKRTGVYAEPSMLSRAVNEFSDITKMMDATEKLYGAYPWGRYDVLVLPPSFPYGGMENPRLTFLSPTIIAGDKSLVSVLAHELAHSWSGNLVTNASWEDFWLNEGFTTYFERRIIEAIYGIDQSKMEFMIGLHSLQEQMDEKKTSKHPGDNQLFINLKGRNPDEGVSFIPYEKGALFIATIESAVGRETLDAFLRDYFSTYAFQTMTTEKFIQLLSEKLIAVHPDKSLAKKLQVKEWIYGRGIPSGAVKIESDAFAKVNAELAKWENGATPSKLETKKWATAQWIYFVSKLPKKMEPEKLAELDRAFRFTKSGNAEILVPWLQSAVRNDYEPAYSALEMFLTSVGRLKYLRPLYTEMINNPKTVDMAKRVATKAKPGYHPSASTAVSHIVK